MGFFSCRKGERVIAQMGLKRLVWLLAVALLCAEASSAGYSSCPQGFIRGEKSGLCLSLGKGRLTYDEAELSCAEQGDGVHLVTVFDNATLEDLGHLCRAAYGKQCRVGAKLKRCFRYSNDSGCAIGESPAEFILTEWTWPEGCVGFPVDLWGGETDSDVVNSTRGDCALFDGDLGRLVPTQCSKKYPFVCSDTSATPACDRGPFGVQNDTLAAALRAIKANVTCDPYRLLDNWNGDIPCKYRGVSCLSDGDVVGLSLQDWSLQTGGLSPSIGLLTSLGFLHLPGNHFRGALPSEINNLKLLAELDIADNEFQGPFPDIRGLDGLVYLDLRFNKFSGRIPDWVYTLPLDVLIVNNNDFDGPLSESVAGLDRASLMILANNKLESVLPESIGRLSSVAQLLLQNNRFRNVMDEELLADIFSDQFIGDKLPGALPKTIGNLTGLLSIDLSENSLAGNIPSEIGALEHLVEIALSANNITGSIPASFMKLVNVKSIDLQRNALQGSIHPFFKMPSLQRAILRDNFLNGSVPKGSKVTNLEVGGNCLFAAGSTRGQKEADTCMEFYDRVSFQYWKQPEKPQVTLRLWAIPPIYLVRFVMLEEPHSIKGTGSSKGKLSGKGTGSDIQPEGFEVEQFFIKPDVVGYTCAADYNHFGSLRIIEKELNQLENKTYTFRTRETICEEANPCAFFGDSESKCISQPQDEDFPFVCNCSNGYTFVGYSCYPGEYTPNPKPEPPVVPPPPPPPPPSSTPPPPPPPPPSKPPPPPAPVDKCAKGGEYYEICQSHGDEKALCRLDVCGNAYTCLCSPGFQLFREIKTDGFMSTTCKPAQ